MYVTFFFRILTYVLSFFVISRKKTKDFLEKEKLDVSDDILNYCGLKDDNSEFDVGVYLSKCLDEFYKNKKYKATDGKWSSI